VVKASSTDESEPAIDTWRHTWAITLIADSNR